MFLYKEKKAMSFVEIVLVLAVIGVVASLTIPGLKKHSQRTEMAQLAKKAYLNLNEAVDNASLTAGPISSWSFSDKKAFFNSYIAPNIKHTDINAEGAYLYSVDNMRIQVVSCGSGVCTIQVDVNADTPPNLNGKDIFRYDVNKNNQKVIPSASYGTEALWKNNWKFTDGMWSTSY